MTATAALPRPDVACLHCGNAASGGSSFCCAGCELVYGFLRDGRLERYYALRGEAGVPVPDAHVERRDLKWLDAIEETRRAQPDAIARVDLDVQGLHCSACVWLIDTLFARRNGGVKITVNPSLGRAQLLVGPSFPLGDFVRDVERFGYLFGPALKRVERPSNGLALRMGICLALAMNAMIFAIANYAGLRAGPTFDLLQRWNLIVSVASMLVGGSVFIRSAWRGLRSGVLHLDLPIALGIGLAFSGSLYGYFAHRTAGVYIDTLDVFIALMLVGRFLQERVLEKNRLALLESDGVEGLLARRERDGGVETVRCTELRTDDRIVVASGDLVPLDATLVSGAASFSLDWINGESRARTYPDGAVVPAGAFLASTGSATLRAREDFARSTLVDLLRTPLARAADSAMSAPWWRTLAKWYVVGVLAAAAIGFGGWMLATHDVGRSLEIATAVLVVTCPCAFGIATPLAYDLVQAGLRRAGLFVRNAGFLDRAERVKRVVFDKTGTLTNGALGLADDGALERLGPRHRALLASMVAASAHPKSAAVHRALTRLGAKGAPARELREETGHGLVLVDGADELRFGAPRWAAPGSRATGDLAFAENGRLLADLTTVESLRPGAAMEGGGAPHEGVRRVAPLGRRFCARDANGARGRHRRVARDRRGQRGGEGALGRRPRPRRYAHDRRRHQRQPRRRRRFLQRDAGDRPPVHGRAERLLLRHPRSPLHPPRARGRREARRRPPPEPRPRVGLQRAVDLARIRGRHVTARVRCIHAGELAHHDPRDDLLSELEERAVEVLSLQVFVSLALVAGSLVLFAFTCRQRDFEHADRLALLPLDKDDDSHE